MKATRLCSVDGCGRKHLSRGWCDTHYRRVAKFGHPGPADIHPHHRGISDYERCLAYVDVSAGPDDCHPWTGHTRTGGYGSFTVDGKSLLVTRWLLGYLRGSQLLRHEYALHRCDNPPCCNPRHLYVGTAADNVRDMMSRGRGRNGMGSYDAA